MQSKSGTYWEKIEIALTKLTAENAPTPDLQKKYAGKILEETRNVLNLKSQGNELIKFNVEERYQVDQALQTATEIYEVDIDRFVIEYEGETSFLITTFKKQIYLYWRE